MCDNGPAPSYAALKLMYEKECRFNSARAKRLTQIRQELHINLAEGPINTNGFLGAIRKLQFERDRAEDGYLALGDLLPKTFYASCNIIARIKLMVKSWQGCIETNKDLEDALQEVLTQQRTDRETIAKLHTQLEESKDGHFRATENWDAAQSYITTLEARMGEAKQALEKSPHAVDCGVNKCAECGDMADACELEHGQCPNFKSFDCSCGRDTALASLPASPKWLEALNELMSLWQESRDVYPGVLGAALNCLAEAMKGKV